MATFKVTVKKPTSCNIENLYVNNRRIKDFVTPTTFTETLTEIYEVRCIGRKQGLVQLQISIEINGVKQPDINLPENPSYSIINHKKNYTPILE